MYKYLVESVSLKDGENYFTEHDDIEEAKRCMEIGDMLYKAELTLIGLAVLEIKERKEQK